jgi:hypothetical protein
MNKIYKTFTHHNKITYKKLYVERNVLLKKTKTKNKETPNNKKII